MHTDDAFLRAILANPADDTPRLIYADWLDEQDDDASKLKAAFLRFELDAAKLPDETLRKAAVGSRIRKQAADLDPAWLAVVSHPALEECGVRFEFECPAKWENLTATADVKVRFCGSCKRNVHYCDTIAEARHHANRGNCVAVSLALVRRPNDLAPRPMLAGRIRLTPDMIERLGRPAIPEQETLEEVVEQRLGRAREPEQTPPRRNRRQNRNVPLEDEE